MAIDPSPSTSTSASSTDPSALPAIENEFPTYRAISSAAVLSLVFGVFSVFCYADLWFLIVSAAGVALGLFALRKIRQLPDVLTGAGLARVGIGVSLLFGLTALTRVVTQELTIHLEAGSFAREYIRVIKDEPVSLALWYQQPITYRAEKKNLDELVAELKKNKDPMSGNDVYSQNAKPITEIKERLDGGKGGEIAYSGIETKAIDGMTTYANALARLDLKGTKEHPEREAYALFQLVKGGDGGRLDWVVKEVKFPYTPRSAVATAEKKGDEHGHGH